MLKSTFTRKAIAATFLLLFLTNTLAPLRVYALTSGPTSPEANSFEPIDTTDMVNLETGDFNYNIPLLEVPGPEGGYPLSLSYHAGIQPNSDASWVGLGWSLNPGAINRHVSGYADDWENAAVVRRDYWQGGVRETWSIGVSIGLGGKPSAGVGFNLSVANDTYRGFGVGMGVDAWIETGLVGVSAGFGYKPYNQLYGEIGGSIGLPGGTAIQGGISLDQDVDFSFGLKSGPLGISMTSSGAFGLQAGPLSAGIHNSNKGKIQTKTRSFGIGMSKGKKDKYRGIQLGYSHTRYWSDETVNVPVHGSLFMNGKDLAVERGFDSYSLADYPYFNIVDYPDPNYLMGGSFPDFDSYQVTGQGIGGGIRPHLFQGYMASQPRKDENGNTLIRYYVPGASDPANAAIPHINPKFRFEGDFSNQFRQSQASFSNINNMKSGTVPFDPSPIHGNNDGSYGGNGTDNTLAGSKHIEYVFYHSIMDGVNYAGNFIKPSNASGFSRPYITSNDTMYNQIGGFSITNESGVTYHYGLPAYSYNEYLFNEKIDKSKAPGHSNSWSRTHKAPKYAYTWYLTTVTGPDYVDRNNNKIADEGDWGYWVNFDYGKWTSTYYWRNPSEGFHRDLDYQFQGNAKGTKEVYYLNAIRTRTHTAFFEKSLREDGKSSSPSIMNHDDNQEPFGTFDENSRGALRLDRIYLFTNSDISSVNPSNSNLYTYPSVDHHGENIIDRNDIPEAVKANALRVIDFDYDYSLCPKTSNSFNYNSGGAKSGKLTLKNLIFKGAGNVCKIPPMKFFYELEASEKKSGPITLNNDINASMQSGTMQSPTSFLKGDILYFTYNGNVYYATITENPSANVFKLHYLNAIPPAAITVNAETTKNPVYNKDAVDMWGMFKSDFKNVLAFGSNQYNVGNENMARQASEVSAKSVDVWSLRKVSLSSGADIKMEYESDTYSKSVLNDSYSFVASNIEKVASNQLKITFNDLNTGASLNDYYQVGQIPEFIMLVESLAQSSLLASQNPCGWSLRNYNNIVYNSKNTNNPPVIQQIGSNFLIIQSQDFLNYFQSPVMVTEMQTGNSIYTNCEKNNKPSAANFKIYPTNLDRFGGGIRTKRLTVVSENIKYSTVYNYSFLNASVSSGTTSFEPWVLDIANFIYNNPNTVGRNLYKKELYKNVSKLLTISREVPPPGIAYEWVGVKNEVTHPGEQPRESDNLNLFQFEVFKENMVVYSNNYRQNNIGSLVATHNFSLKDFTSRLGSLKRQILYGKNHNGGWLKLTETINQYLDDGLEELDGKTFAAKYVTKLAPYNYQGVIMERYVEVKDHRDPLNPTNSTMYTKGVLATKEEYPNISIGQTVVNYKAGTQSSTKALGFDFYSGQVTKQLSIDDNGNRFLTEITPAYRKYAAMGLKIGNSSNKNMLTQSAASHTYKVDGNNTSLGLVTASIQTWSNDVDVLTTGYSIIKQDNSNSQNGNVWRKKMSYEWASIGFSNNNITPIASFVNFDWNSQNNPNAQNANWQKTNAITLYDVFSNPLEASDINGSFVTTKMGYKHSRVIVSAKFAKSSEVVFTSAEDEVVNGMLSGEILLGKATVSNNPADAHSGYNSVSINAGDEGLSYTIDVSKLQQGRDYYASVWVKSPGRIALPSDLLYFQVDGASRVYGTVTGTNGNSWYQVNLTVPASALTSGSSLTVGCNNSAGFTLQFDDFRFNPLTSEVTSYVYNKAGELTHILDNNNLFTAFEYDEIGRLIKTYRETISGNTIKPVSEHVYNYGLPIAAFSNDAIVNQAFIKNDCPPGQIGSSVLVTVPSGQFTSCNSQQEANDAAYAYAQSFANQNGTCGLPYARVEYVNQYWQQGYNTYTVWADVVIRLYADDNCTIPYYGYVDANIHKFVWYHSYINPWSDWQTSDYYTYPLQGEYYIGFSIPIYHASVNPWSYEIEDETTENYYLEPGNYIIR